jgi:hypothetical protein
MNDEGDCAGGTINGATPDIPPLVPEAGPPPDSIMEAIGKLADDPGAIFKPATLILLRRVRASDPQAWARYRQAIKETHKVSMPELDRLTRISDEGQVSGLEELFPEVEPWPDPVDGASLLDEIASTIQRYVIADPPTIHATTLWIAFTWFIDVVDVAPIANITAPEKRCGKTVLLTILGKLGCRPLQASNISAAALYRTIEKWKPTLLIDEVDTFLPENEGLRGVLNAGFTRDSAFVIRCVGDDNEPAAFNVWGAKALCGIGKLAATLEDRSIPFRLRRKLPGEHTIKIRRAHEGMFNELASKLTRFAFDHQYAVGSTPPKDIEGLNDRANDCWEPLLAIAEVVGGHWPRRARNAAIALHGVEEEMPSIGVELIMDIKAVFEGQRVDKIFSTDLLKALVADEEATWATWNRGKPMAFKQLSKRLAEYGIKPKQIRIGLETGRNGYELSDFSDVFKRYIPTAPPFLSSTPLQAMNGVACSDLISSTSAIVVEDKKQLQATDGVGCRGVEDSAPQEGGKEGVRPCFTGKI